jgi:hypothetical protein
VTNFGTCAILALPRLPERQLRFLLALETFTRGEDGWRQAGTALLAKTAGLSVNTAVKACGELVASGAIDYHHGSGRGKLSTYRIKVLGIADHLSGQPKVPNIAGDLSAPERYPNGARKGTQTGSVKVPKRNAVTSANANTALEASALGSSALRAGRGGGPATAVRAMFPGATDDVIEALIRDRAARGARNPAAVLAHEARQGTLRLPCDRTGPGAHSDPCRHGDSPHCGMDWCQCRCHTQPTALATEWVEAP